MRIFLFVICLFFVNFLGAVDLRVALYPYIPDSSEDQFRSMTHRIKHEFQALNPGVNLEIRPLDPAENFYKTSFLKGLLGASKEAATEEPYDVIEVDGMFLTALQSDAGVWPEAFDVEDWNPAARAGWNLTGHAAFPHLMCAHIIFSQDPSLRESDNIVDYASRKDVSIGMDLSSWSGTSLVYLDLWSTNEAFKEDGHRGTWSRILEASKLDYFAVKKLVRIARTSQSPEGNPALEGKYKSDPKGRVDSFLNERISAFVGYPEFLYHLHKEKGEDYVKSLSYDHVSLQRDSSPTVFVDYFVKRKGLTSEKEDAAIKFAQYMNMPETFAWMTLGKDKGEGACVPRYLAPASHSVYSHPAIKEHGFYRFFQKTFRNAVLFPIVFPETLKQEMHIKLKEKIASDVSRSDTCFTVDEQGRHEEVFEDLGVENGVLSTSLNTLREVSYDLSAETIRGQMEVSLGNLDVLKISRVRTAFTEAFSGVRDFSGPVIMDAFNWHQLYATHDPHHSDLMERVKSQIFPRVSLLVLNLQEAEFLLKGTILLTEQGVRKGLQQLSAFGVQAVFLKDVSLPDGLEDYLFDSLTQTVRIRDVEEVSNREQIGGVIAGYMAQGHNLTAAISLTQRYLQTKFLDIVAPE
jgi:thiamine pyridinylase